MLKNQDGCFALRWFALAGLMLGASVIAGPGALGQASNPSGAVGPTLSPAAQTQNELAAAGVAVPGRPLSATGADGTGQSATDQSVPPVPPTEPSEAAAQLPQGPGSPSGVIGAAPGELTPTTSDLAAAGVAVR